MGKDMSVRRGVTKIATEYDGTIMAHAYPFIDIDEICTISPDGKTIQIVSTGLGKTMTEIYTLNIDGGYTKGVVIT